MMYSALSASKAGGCKEETRSDSVAERRHDALCSLRLRAASLLSTWTWPPLPW